MTPKEKFIARSLEAKLPYVKEAVAGLRDGTAKLTGNAESVSPASADDLLRTYERRVAHLSEIETDHARIMTVDAKFLCDALHEMSGRACSVWLIEREPHFTYAFFETVDDHRIFGAIKSVDDRKLSGAERVQYWGTKG